MTTVSLANYPNKLQRYVPYNFFRILDDALIQEATISKFPNPRKFDRDALSVWMMHGDGGNNFLKDAELELEPFDIHPSLSRKELVAISANREFDIFSTFLAERIAPRIFRRFYRVYTSIVGRKADALEVEVDDGYFAYFAKILSVFLATIFPSIAVVILYFIHSMITRLWVIMLFSFVFATTLALFTNAKPIEIFAITAACASVQVVFVGSAGLESTKSSMNSTSIH